jgi:hypothetical protein
VNPEAQSAGLVEWQLFVTLTFQSDKLPGKVRLTLLFAWLRELAVRAGITFKQCKWMLRQEAGEVTGRLHYHLLIGGLPPEFATISNCFRLALVWDHEPEKRAPKYNGKCLRVGMSRVRLFDASLDGVAYCLKGAGSITGADLYEYSKFSQDTSTVTLSESLIAELQTRMRAGSRSERRRKSRQRRRCDFSHPLKAKLRGPLSKADPIRPQ